VKAHRFLREALEEYEDAIAYYERLRSGLGASFILDFDQVIATTLEFPEMGPLVEGAPAHLGIRRRLLQRFGVEIDYMRSGDTLIIIAVFPGKRRPGYWRDRLRRLP
jgi:plasmid stabilization system protein ParE